VRLKLDELAQVASDLMKSGPASAWSVVVKKHNLPAFETGGSDDK
jgi:hypothetical protein